MKINLGQKGEREQAQVGDIIQFEDGTIGIDAGSGRTFVLKSEYGDEVMTLYASNSKYSSNCFDIKYKILAHACEWEIRRTI